MTSRLLIAAAVLLAACSPMVYTDGVPNLAEVEPGVWRSGQITTELGWHTIRDIARGRHVHVVKLNYGAEAVDAPPAAFGFEILSLPIQPQDGNLVGVFVKPDMARVHEALAEIATCATHPATDLCLVHCSHGQDRTGFVIGRFRVEHDHWTKDRAYDEMRVYHFHPELVGLLRAWVDSKGP